MSAPEYYLLVPDIAKASAHDRPTILAAAAESRDGFLALWQEHDLHHLVLKADKHDASYLPKMLLRALP